jgi:hypothetical protein
MRFLLFLCLGLFSPLASGQDLLSSGNIAPRTASADIPTRATLTSAHDQASVPFQQTPASTNLVDAPSATQHTTCTQKNGKPCPEWLHRMIGQYPPLHGREQWNGQLDRFLTIGNGRRALHPDKKSWMWFAVAHAGMWASTVIAVRDSPTSKEKAGSEYPAIAALTGMDLLLFKTISPALSVGPPVYALIHYSRAASK